MPFPHWVRAVIHWLYGRGCTTPNAPVKSLPVIAPPVMTFRSFSFSTGVVQVLRGSRNDHSSPSSAAEEAPPT